MATFVLVHGAWQGGWCWRRVAKLLREAGHDVFTPTLTGLGERSHLFSRDIDLDTHIRDVLAVIECEELSDIVLCGHSYGGMVVTGVADHAPEKIRSLVYLDALVPDDGQNTLDCLPAEAASGLRDGSMDGRAAPGPAEAFSVNADDRAWVDKRNVAHPFRSFEQPIRLVGNWEKVARRIYVYATGWTPGIGRPYFEKASHQTEWRAGSVECGHYVMIDMPEELTRILSAEV